MAGRRGRDYGPGAGLGMEHDLSVTLRLVAGLGWWWFLRGRRRVSTGCCARPPTSRAGQRQMVGRAAVAQLDGVELRRYGRGAGSFHRPAGRGRRAGAVPGAGRRPGRPGRSTALGRHGEAAEDNRRALAVAREIAFPLGQVRALGHLAAAALYAGDLDGAVRLARQAGQITAGIPGPTARWCSYVLAYTLTEAGELAAAEAICAAALAQARDAGDLRNQGHLLSTDW